MQGGGDFYMSLCKYVGSVGYKYVCNCYNSEILKV